MAKEQNEQKNLSVTYKALGSVGATLGANLARKGATKTWRAATGHEPPAKPEQTRVGFAEAAAWAALSAIAVSVAQTVVRRRVVVLAHRRS